MNHGTIESSDFANLINKSVFLAIGHTQEKLKDGEDMHNINEVAVYLEGKKYLDNIGGLVKFTEYHPAIGESYFFNVKELKRLTASRQLYYVLRKVSEELRDEKVDAEGAIDSLLPYLKKYGDIDTETRTLKDAVKDEITAIFDFIEAKEKGEEPLIGIPTGIKTLDSIIGGLPIGVPTVIAARPGEGKSTLALNIANNVAKQNMGVHLFTYEDGERSFSQRIIALRTNNDLAQIVHRKLDDNSKMRIRAMKSNALDRIRIEKAHRYSAKQIARSFRANKKALNTKLIIIDYLQLMPGENKQSPTHEQLERNMQELSAMAAQEDVAMIVLSQLKRETQGIEPKLNDLRGSGSIEQIGKLIIALHAATPESTELKFIVLKNFQGRRGYIFGDYNRAECSIR
jgi:replicative DNA helicase